MRQPPRPRSIVRLKSRITSYDLVPLLCTWFQQQSVNTQARNAGRKLAERQNRRGMRREDRDALAKKLRKHEVWIYFVSCTLPDKRNKRSAERTFRRFYSRVARRAGVHFRIFFGYGPQPFHGERYHFHAVVGQPFEGGGLLSAESIGSMWRGRCEVEQYNPEEFGVDYCLSEYKHHFYYGYDIACPQVRRCRHRHGCVHARSGGTGPAADSLRRR